MSVGTTGETASDAPETPVGLVRGTRDWLIEDYSRLRALESSLLDGFETHGYRPVRTPLLERSDLHERKSGAGIVAKLEEVADGREGRVCLRPELTAGIVRAYVEAADPPSLPWRVCMSGPVFRHQSLAPGLDREFTQVGVERIGDGGPAADAEIIWLADWSLRTAGIAAPRLRIGHVGLILEMLQRSGLPHAVRVALVEVISEAAAEGHDVRAVETRWTASPAGSSATTRTRTVPHRAR
jgi:histidyl-tRNA synthetase